MLIAIGYYTLIIVGSVSLSFITFNIDAYLFLMLIVQLILSAPGGVDLTSADQALSLAAIAVCLSPVRCCLIYLLVIGHG
jgi:hypothetical protein